MIGQEARGLGARVCVSEMTNVTEFCKPKSTMEDLDVMLTNSQEVPCVMHVS